MNHSVPNPFRISVMLLMMALAAVSCGPRPVILDTDWWTDVDDAMAVRLALRADERDEIRLMGICVDAVRETSIPSLRAFLQLEGRPEIPIGADLDATDYNGEPCYHDMLIQAAGCKDAATAEPCTDFYKSILSRSRRKVDIVAIGYSNALASLLASDPDLVRRKVRHLWMMAGRYPEGKENNFTRTRRSREAGAALVSGWPTPITFLGFEAGCDVLCGAALAQDDILHKVICRHQSSGVRSSWDPLTLWMAILGSPESAGFSIVPGRCVLDPQTGSNTFEPHADGPHRYVVPQHEPAWYAARLDSLLR